MILKKFIKNSVFFLVVIICTLTIAFFLITATGSAAAEGRPQTVAEVALYQGADREQVLIEGAKKEGEFIFYNSNSWMTNVVSKAFGKKYPFIKVSVARMRSKRMIKRIMEEYAADRHKVDVIETSHGSVQILHKYGIFQEFYTPEMAYYPADVKKQGESGVYYLADREIYYAVGYNTNEITPPEAPKTYEDLLDPKWKGKMSIVASGTGIRFIGHILHAMGREYLDKLARQDVKVQNISAAAMATLIVSGEVPLSPTAGRTNITLAKNKGAPVAWFPVQPVLTTIGLSGITTKAPHPHASMLFLDYLHSKEGQSVVMKGLISSPRTDIGSTEERFKKDYLDSRYPIEIYEKKYSEWETLMRKLFIRKN